MEDQLHSFTDYQGNPYKLVPLPWPAPQYAKSDGHRLPATYANFLIINEAVLVPIYQDKADAKALATLANCFPDRQIVGINCLPVIQWHGSLHCMTMQLPVGVLS
jgi:agmatine/peptidylarginine deiminase